MTSWTNTRSEAISGFGYDPTNQVLRVAFRSGSVYEYQHTPANLVKDLLHAPSKGAFFASHIRDRFPFTRVK
jgi:hypothetical protein